MLVAHRIVCYHSATGTGQAIPTHQEDGSSDSSVFLVLARRGSCQVGQNRVCKPQVGGSIPLASFLVKI